MQKREDIITWYSELSDLEKMDEFSALVYSHREDFIGADVSSIELIMDKVEIDYTLPTRHGENIIFFAIETFSPSVLKLLINKGVPVNIKNSKDQTPIEYAESVLRKELYTKREDRKMVQLAKQNVGILGR